MNHEGHEDHEAIHRPFSMRLPSPLAEGAEHAMTETIGCAIAVHRALGPGFLESIYKKAMHLELNARGISYESEKPVRCSTAARKSKGSALT